jgi:hypothetical protein
MTGTISTVGPRLNANDRCDMGNCGAQAYVAVSLRGGVLLFCAHHYAAQPATLANLALAIQDDREQLVATSKLDVSA